MTDASAAPADRVLLPSPIPLDDHARAHDLARIVTTPGPFGGVVFRRHQILVAAPETEPSRPEVEGWVRWQLYRHLSSGWCLRLDYVAIQKVHPHDWFSVVTPVNTEMRDDFLSGWMQASLRALLTNIAQRGPCDQDVSTIVSTMMQLGR